VVGHLRPGDAAPDHVVEALRIELGLAQIGTLHMHHGICSSLPVTGPAVAIHADADALVDEPALFRIALGEVRLGNEVRQHRGAQAQQRGHAENHKFQSLDHQVFVSTSGPRA